MIGDNQHQIVEQQGFHQVSPVRCAVTNLKHAVAASSETIERSRALKNSRFQRVVDHLPTSPPTVPAFVAARGRPRTCAREEFEKFSGGDIQLLGRRFRQPTGGDEVSFPRHGVR